MHDWIKLPFATSVLVLVVLLDLMGVVPQADCRPDCLDPSFEHNRIVKRQVLGSPIPNAHACGDVNKDFARPLRHERSINAWSVELTGK
jgi:hypothetical protein